MYYEQQRERIFKAVRDFNGENFEPLALEIFRFQARYNPVYAQFLSLLNVDIQKVESVLRLPFLPIQFFKNYAVKTGNWVEEAVFSSSGTTGPFTSRHYVRDLNFYRRNTLKGFTHFYGQPERYCFLALLPSYLERSGSSLVVMADEFIRQSKHPCSGFFLNNTEALVKVLKKQVEVRQPVFLLGVSFALLDLAEQFPLDLAGGIVMETGGMKGRRREMTRNELHEVLKNAFHLSFIHSEYGMTELFSQAYSKGDGLFFPSPAMRVLAREITDPLTLLPANATGALNIIDLANFDTCSFIATDDLARVGENGSFEVLGRLDNSDIRGCNLMA